MYNYPLVVNELKDNEWSSRTFLCHEEFTLFVESNVKVPGKYGLDPDIELWKASAITFTKEGEYTDAVPNTSAWLKYWNLEKSKVINGVIINGIYLPGFFYFYLNFCPIFNRKKRTETFPDVFDSDYHFFLYLLLCILKGKHAVIVKTRQRGYSYKIMAVLMWSYWWFKGAVNTIGASDEEFTQKSWEYINNYRSHLNANTAWIRGPYPIAKNLDWIERTFDENGTPVGLNSKLKGLTFKQSPTKGVGGAQSFFFYEEAGIAPTLLQTIGYIRPAVEMGNITTGTIIISGSVGELDHCQDLKTIFENPDTHNFLSVSNIFEENATHERIGFFVPDTWSLEGFIDEYGNSKVEEARAFILDKRKKAEEGKKNEDYQLQLSQSPLTPAEAFAFRKRSFFPAALINKQQEKIDITKPSIKPVILYEHEDKVKWRFADREGDPKPIKVFPIPDSVKDIRGCVEIEEMPETENPQFLTYFAGVDPIGTDKTTTSESLFSVTIFKTLTEIKYFDEDEKPQIKITGFKAVAWYTGRMEDLKANNSIGELLIKLYNAFAIIESNIQTLINHMQGKGLQKYMATKKEIGFLEDLNANQNVHKTYGVHMTPVIKSYILQNIKDYMLEEIDIVRKPDGEVVKIVYGVERINDTALLQEAKMYREGLNTDRLISFGLALSIAKHYVVNGLFTRIDKQQEKDKTPIPLPTKSFFRTMSNYGDTKMPVRKRSYFKNIA